MAALVKKLWLLIIGVGFCCFVEGQSCTSASQFANSWNFAGASSADFFEVLPNNQVILGGNANGRLTAIKIDSSGKAIWMKNYHVNNNVVYQENGRFRPDPSGQYVASVAMNNIMMTDTAGNPLKAVQLNVNIPYVTGTITDVQCMPNGDKIVLISVGASGVSHILVRISADLSTVLWNTIIDASYINLQKVKLDGDTILLPGAYNTATGVLLSFKASNGQFIKKLAIAIENVNTVLSDINSYDQGYVVSAIFSNTDNHVILRLNKNFDLLNAYKIKGISTDQIVSLVTEPGGNFFGSAGSWTSIPSVFSVSSADSILWSHRNIAMITTFPLFLRKMSNGLITLYNSNYDAVGVGPFTLYGVAKTDMNGYLGTCAYGDLPLQKSPVNVVNVVANITIRDTTLVTLTDATVLQESVNYPDYLKCVGISTCNTVKILPGNITCSHGTETFTAQRNVGCSTPVKWTITGGPTVKQEWNDSTINIQFLQAGQYKLKAEIQSCQPIADSVEVTVTSIGLSINLGADTVICPGNTITLNAHAGFASYLWQDGSTDSIFQATQPGTYYVRTTDFCGNIFRDTILIAPHPPIPFTAGPDRSKCNTDTIHLDATAGFMNYTWSNNYHISSLSNQSVIVNPDVDTSYFVKAEKTPGCFAFDTVHITVYHSPQINLGADTSFCNGDSIILHAGNGFSSILWNDGTTNQQLIARTARTYSVVGTTAQGCKSYDTLNVLNVYANPIVSLNKNFGLCLGSTYILDAGAFSSYLWQDGSTSRTFVVDRLGNYFVQVTDAHNCIGSDTVNIQTIHAPPSGFLPADTVMCQYTTLNVSSTQNFNTYNWSNGSTAKTISVKSGTYWLQVKDNYGCVGKDTINISLKDCLKGVFIPTAFTPDHDGKDDVFRALVNGPIKSFELSIYNRWGQLVYQARDWSRGWDGTVAGHPSDTGTYVWICRYQFEGEIAHVDKGTVVLIR